MPINECCNTNVVCCEADATVPRIAALMREHHVGDVVVVMNAENGLVPVGIVTDRDIVVETLALELDAEIFTAGDIMNSPLVTARIDDGLVETLRLMREHKVRRMPVVNAQGTLHGIVTADDIIGLLTIELAMMAAAIVEQPEKEGRLRK